jgi:hypothetical protein
MTPQELQALEIARGLAQAGIPVFVAQPDPSTSVGYKLPRNWQQTRPDPAVVNTWQPGMALAVVMGHGLDLLDVDPRSGGDASALNGSTPYSYGLAATPSGGVHSFIRSLGVRSRDNVLPGIDVKAGEPNGKGRGFAFIAPTVRASKVTGELLAYQWVRPPDLAQLQTVLRGELVDESGAGLRDLIAAARAHHSAPSGGEALYTGPTFDQMPEAMQQLVTTWVSKALEGICAELKTSGEWGEGQTDDRGRGWEKLQADAALRLGQLARASWNDLELSDAQSIFVATAPTDGTWGLDDVELKWAQQHGRLDPAPWPDLRSASERDAEAWANLGVNTETAARAATPPGGNQPPTGPAGGQADALSPRSRRRARRSPHAISVLAASRQPPWPVTPSPAAPFASAATTSCGPTQTASGARPSMLYETALPSFWGSGSAPATWARSRRWCGPTPRPSPATRSRT